MQAGGWQHQAAKRGRSSSPADPPTRCTEATRRQGSQPHVVSAGSLSISRRAFCDTGREQEEERRVGRNKVEHWGWQQAWAIA